MFFKFDGDAATPVGSKNYKSGSRVNLHPGVMARGDGLHPATSWQNCPRDLCPGGQDVAAPNHVKGCLVPRWSMATPSLGNREALDPTDDWGFHGQTWKPGPPRFVRDNGVDRSRHLYSILEEEDNNDDLELEDEGPGLGSHNNHDECMEGPQVLEVVIGQASDEDNPVEPLQVNPLKGIEFVPI